MYQPITHLPFSKRFGIAIKSLFQKKKLVQLVNEYRYQEHTKTKSETTTELQIKFNAEFENKMRMAYFNRMPEDKVFFHPGSKESLIMVPFTDEQIFDDEFIDPVREIMQTNAPKKANKLKVPFANTQTLPYLRRSASEALAKELINQGALEWRFSEDSHHVEFYVNFYK